MMGGPDLGHPYFCIHLFYLGTGPDLCTFSPQDRRVRILVQGLGFRIQGAKPLLCNLLSGPEGDPLPIR